MKTRSGNFSSALAFVAAIVALGVGIGIDAFGSGYTQSPAQNGQLQPADPITVNGWTPASGTATVTGKLTSTAAVTGSGFTFTSATTKPAASVAYAEYDGTNLVVNVPTGKGVVASVNGSTITTTTPTTGIVGNGGAFNSGSGLVWQDAAVGPYVIYPSSGNAGGAFAGKKPNGATAIGAAIGSQTNLTTVGAKVLSVQNNMGTSGNGTEEASISYAGGMVLSSSLSIVNGAGSGTANAVITQAGDITSRSLTYGSGNLAGTGSIRPGSGATGAAAINNFLLQAFVIDFGAFSAGIDQTSAQAMTGVAFGDACSVGTGTDQSGAIGQIGVFVTSAGNIKISISPTTATSTANPASDTYTVKCLR